MLSWASRCRTTRTRVGALLVMALVIVAIMAAALTAFAAASKESYGTVLLDLTGELRCVGKGAPATGIHYLVDTDEKGRITRVACMDGAKPVASFFLKGASAVTLSYDGAEVERRCFDVKGKPFAVEGVAVVRTRYESGGKKRSAFLGIDSTPKADWDGNFGCQYVWNKDTLDLLPLDEVGKLRTGDHVRISFSKDRLQAKLSLVSSAGTIVPDYESIGIKEYLYDRSGLLKQVRFYDEKGRKTVNAYDVHSQTLRYDQQARFKDVRLEGKTANLIEVRTQL